MEISIETATIQMRDKLYGIEKECFKEEAFSKLQIGYLLADYNDISLAAKANGEIVGFIIGTIEFALDKPSGHIMTIDVVPSYRRMGVARRLMLEIEAILKQKEIDECVLEVREDNVAALGLYQKLGYKKVAVLENYYKKVHGLFLRKTPL